MVVLTERAYLHPTIHVSTMPGALIPAKILVARKRAGTGSPALVAGK